jgi:hypothetical protein
MVLGLLPDVIWISSPLMRRRFAAYVLLGARLGARSLPLFAPDGRNHIAGPR